MKRLLAGLHALKLDRLLYRLWRYNPVALRRLYAHHAFDRRFGVVTRSWLWRSPLRADAGLGSRQDAAGPCDLPERVHVHRSRIGKRHVVLLASTYPFRRVIGVELYEEFHRIAVANLEAFPERQRRAKSVTLECVDAGAYVLPREPAVVYLFNPFSEEILAKELVNIEAHPGPLVVLFYAPIILRHMPWDRRRLFDASPRLKEVRGEKEFTIYALA